MELAVAHVDRVDVGGAAVEEAVREASGRRPGIEGVAPGDGDGEAGEGRIELQAATADEGRGRTRAVRPARRVPRGAPVLRDRSRDEDGTSGDRRLSLLPAREEAPSHELGIEPTAGPDAQLAAFLSDFLPEDFLSDVDVLVRDFLDPDFAVPPRAGVTFLAAAVARWAVLVA